MDKSTATSAIVTLGIDLAKNVFQLHGVDAAGKVVLQRAVKRKDLLMILITVTVHLFRRFRRYASN